ncbi:hypothetical protein DICSQDRAFT_153733 [Dichomitus squalens LYAD-421 SS1]|uniref:uncharacterized protein n=1 Tax=Dichomitus squalens (strain LYAD-421) TaxID=732165 RepID=UPI00044153EE|nr:uncharacterized protein DICSQDRAFT_153733 [Dichomitus squalens LYAD-421 SS1]EJF63932.1 hypothetical protein DICSQDRAFT_153733 [Dichomitus squalens LYAD-421 SS1]
MKRQNDDSAAPVPAKKPRANTAHAAAVALVNSILANPKSYPISGNEDVVRKSLVDLASYARSLEAQLGVSSAPVAGSSKAKAAATAVAAKPARSQADLEVAAEKLRKAAVSGIKKQMSWKPSCKTGSAKWSYDGICNDPEVFGCLMGLGGPPTFKMKKFTVDEFERCLGSIRGSVRYDTLYITSKEVTVRWSDTGEFKFSGSYGKWQPSTADY